MNPTFRDLFKLYNDKFKPAYADLVGYIGDKPVGVLVELENALSHIFVAFDPYVSREVKEENVKKAYNHILRASLDCYKLLWVHLKEDIERIFESNIGALTLTISEGEFLHLRTQFKSKAMEARKREMIDIGKDPLRSVYNYREVTEIGMKIVESVDDSKQKKARNFFLRFKRREILIGFLLGVGSGVLADILYSFFFIGPQLRIILSALSSYLHLYRGLHLILLRIITKSFFKAYTDRFESLLNEIEYVGDT